MFVIRRLEKTFCHDYQNSTCRRPACKFLHCTREEEEIFRRTGYLPNETQYFTSSLKAVDERAPICKVMFIILVKCVLLSFEKCFLK